jgi:hypothetical protein
MQGAVFNVVTKQGGDFFQLDAAYYGQPSAWTSQPIVRTIPNTGGRTSGYERERYRDFTTSLGGPIVRERVRFFAAYQYLRDYGQPGADPAFPTPIEQGVAATADHAGDAAHEQLPGVLGELDAGHCSDAFEATFATHRCRLDIRPLRTRCHRRRWEARVGRYVLDWNMILRRFDDANRIDRYHVSSGNVNQFGQLRSIA